ncbi:hypothetical protein G4B88_021720 [Cannabis sativa]|uniref:RNase H type-1 domain-containing protein n=1 Tax=Cannabis sativa TaxID=3483 RepID=A0A7J6DK98_CANSA|nr:hypothetical protein G4B88_021720 [Cannabis sativa]
MEGSGSWNSKKGVLRGGLRGGHNPLPRDHWRFKTLTQSDLTRLTMPVRWRALLPDLNYPNEIPVTVRDDVSGQQFQVGYTFSFCRKNHRDYYTPVFQQAVSFVYDHTDIDERIVLIDIVNELKKDTMVWKGSVNGKFNVKATNWLDQEHRFGLALPHWKNSIFHGGKGKDLRMLHEDIHKRFAEFSSTDVLRVSSLSSSRSEPRLKVSKNTIFLVTDGAFKDSWCSLAVMAIDCSNVFWEYKSSREKGDSALEAEMKAIYLSLSWAAEKGWDSIILCSNCLVAISALEKKHLPNCRLAGVFFSILSILFKFKFHAFRFLKQDLISARVQDSNY